MFQEIYREMSKDHKYVFDPKQVERSKWSEFVLNHPKGNIFQTPQMYEAYKTSKNFEPVFIACVDTAGNIKVLLSGSIFSEKDGILKHLISRCIIFGGPLLSKDISIIEFLQSYNDSVKKKAVYSRLANLFDNSSEFSGIDSEGYEFKEHLNYNIDLSQSQDDIWNSIQNTRRRQIRRGYRRGITVKVSFEVENMADYYGIVFGIYKNAGLPLQDISFFESVYENLSKEKNIVFFSAYFEDRLIGHRIILAYGKRLYDWYAGDIPEERDKYTNDVLVWEVLKWGNENGYEVFDFGGAGEPGKEYGVRDFKAKFGGELVSFGNYMKVHQPAKYATLQSLLKVHKSLKKSR